MRFSLIPYLRHVTSIVLFQFVSVSNYTALKNYTSVHVYMCVIFVHHLLINPNIKTIIQLS